jgi:hypothetical protein
MDVKMRMMQQQIQIPRPKIMDFDEIMQLSSDEEYPRCFENKPVEHLILQMMTVQHGASNVIKGEGLTDDIWRAMGLCTYGLSNPEFSEILQRRESVTKHIGGKLGVARMGSGSGGKLSPTAGKGVGTSVLGSRGGSTSSSSRPSTNTVGVRSRR